jgi:hypothetical protein
VTSHDPSPGTDSQPDAPAAAVFRISPLNLLGVFALSVCAIPVAFGAPWFWLIYVVPLGLIYWLFRVRTTAGPDGLVARGALRTRRVAWEDVSALRLRSSRTRSRVSAVLRDGPELPLPAVHVRDLPVLAAASGGRLPDPSAAPASPDAAPKSEE